MTYEASLTPADILDEVIQACGQTLSAEVFKEILRLRFSEDTLNQIRSLLWKNSAGTITQCDKSTLENYLLVGQFLDILHAKARQGLRQSNPAAT